MINKDRIIVKKLIFEKSYEGIYTYIPFSDLPLINKCHFINIEKNYDDENSHTLVQIFSDELETQEECDKRVLFYEKLSEENKKNRYKKYLELKKEFDNTFEFTFLNDTE